MRPGDRRVRPVVLVSRGVSYGSLGSSIITWFIGVRPVGRRVCPGVTGLIGVHPGGRQVHRGR